MTFKPVNSKADFVEQEEATLKFWDKQKIFKKSLDLRKLDKRYVFFEGPPSANAKPGVHHVLARAFKDVWPRYKTMQGFFVERKAGWDTHGLPIEVAVEKELGLKNKRDIESYGVAKFNAKCKKMVWKYKEDWSKLTERMAFWLDLGNPYITYDPKYIESLWWIIKQIWDKGLLYEGYKVVPRCTRCGTTLSSHEVAQGYKEVNETSLYVKFRIKNKESRMKNGGNTYILSWTTTPWTLPGNVGLAIDKKIDYVAVEFGKEKLILAKDLIEKIFNEKPKVVDKFKGEDLVGWEYEPLFAGAIPKSAENYKNAFKIYPADFVTTEEGTGVVHTAVMYGVEDYELGEQVGLPKVHTVDETGKFLPSVKKWAGKYVKDERVEREIVEDLRRRGLLFKEMPYKHDYPFCWRCETPLLYYASHSWFIKMSKLRNQLLKNNRGINWVPKHVKEGRFGEWLKEAKDWAFSRERYWGTPLPIWKSETGDVICVGSYDELKKLAKDKKSLDKLGTSFDPHKPFIDKIILEKEGKKYKRVPEIIDVWFDSGAMPFAQWHYPFENQEKIDDNKVYPAEFIAEAVDQTRGWFYTLLAVATLLGKGPCYRNVISLGHVLDKHGKKMSKSKGNVVDPWKLFDSYGSDALRWYLYSVNQPGVPKNFDEDGVKQVVRRFMLTLWNTYSFFVTYANIDKFDVSKIKNVKLKNVLDKWIWARRSQLVADVSKHLDNYEPMQATHKIEDFVDDLSNWYVRRSRRRFWKGEMDADKNLGYITFYNVLMDLSKLLAPFMPFLSEQIYSNLKTKQDPESVHLTDWPVAEKIDKNVIDLMKTSRELVEIGLSQREDAGIKVRQPLSSYEINIKGLPEAFVEIIVDELNVKGVKIGKKNKLDTKITSELKIEGVAREIVRSIQILRKQSGLKVEDRIKVGWQSDGEDVQKAFKIHAKYIRTETLADILDERSDRWSKDPTGSGGSAEIKINGNVVKLVVKKKRNE